jgi:hypothetical protein
LIHAEIGLAPNELDKFHSFIDDHNAVATPEEALARNPHKCIREFSWTLKIFFLSMEQDTTVELNGVCHFELINLAKLILHFNGSIFLITISHLERCNDVIFIQACDIVLFHSTVLNYVKVEDEARQTMIIS